MNKLYKLSPAIIQNILISAGKSWNDRYFRKYLYTHYNELRKTEKYSLAELEEIQKERLKSIIREAYLNVPYYNELLKKNKLHPDDIKELSDIQKIPILKKDDIRKNYKKLFNQTIKKKVLFHSHTSGTTGAQLKFAMDYITQSYYWAHAMRHRKWHGMNMYKDWCASLGSKRIIYTQKKPFWRYDTPDRLILYSTYDMTNDNLFDYYRHIKSRRIKYIKGASNNVYLFARFLNNYRLKLPMKGVFVGAEPVYDFMKSEIERAFCSQINDFYGNSEETARAYDCHEHKGLHMAMETILMEICDKEGEPLKDGEYGEIVGTNLTNYAFPLIRYSTGDRSKVLGDHCNCKYNHKLIDYIKIRADDILITKSNKLFSPRLLRIPFFSLSINFISVSQIIQNEPGKILINIEKGSNFNNYEFEIFKKRMNEEYGNEFEITYEFRKIKFEPGKKFRWVVKEK